MNRKKLKKIKYQTIVYTALTLIIIYVLTIGFLLYVFDFRGSKIVITTAKIIPYPAAIVKNKFITLKEFSENLQAVKNFYEVQDFSQLGFRVDFTTDDGKKRLKIKEKQLLNKMIENEIIEILAKEYGINITTELVDQSVERKLDEYGTTKEVPEGLKRLYGWTMKDFKNKVVQPSLYAENLEKLILERFKDEFSTNAQAKINEAKKELDKRVDFTEVAKKYSEGSTAQEGGELGWFLRDQLLPEVAAVAYSLKKGTVSDVIESSLGYHIIELEDKKTEENNELVKIRQIFTRKKDFSDWLSEKIKDFQVYVPLKDFYWDKEKGMVDFTSEDMKKFEKDLIENSQGDISVMF